MPNGIAQQHEGATAKPSQTGEARKGQNELAEDEKTQREVVSTSWRNDAQQ